MGASLVYLVNRDNVVVAEGSHGASFAEETLDRQRVLVHLRLHDFEGDRPPQGGVQGPKDHGHSPLAEQPGHPIAAEPTQFAAVAWRRQEGKVLDVGVAAGVLCLRRHGFGGVATLKP